MTKDEVEKLLISVLDKETESLESPLANDWIKIEKKFDVNFQTSLSLLLN